MRPKIVVLNGPNLNLLGQRQPEIYGRDTLASVEANCRKLGEELGLDLDFKQSNHEGVLIDWIHEARTSAAGLIMNPGAFTHTSVAIMDAMKTCEFPILEVHISNVHQREAFRHHSYISLVATAVMAGFGVHGYELALRHIAHLVGAKG